MLSDRCLSCLSLLSVTLVYCGQNSWMDQDETWHTGRPRPWPHCVSWGPNCPSSKGAQQPPIFGPYLLWPNGWMDQDVTWYEGRTRPRRLCVRWGPSFPLAKKEAEPPPQFSAHVHYGETDGWIKMALGTEVGLGPGYIVLDWDPAPLPKKGAEPLPNFKG